MVRNLGHACFTADRWSHRRGFERSEPDGQGGRSCDSTKCISLKRLSVLVGLHYDRRGPSLYTRDKWRPSKREVQGEAKERVPYSIDIVYVAKEEVTILQAVSS